MIDSWPVSSIRLYSVRERMNSFLPRMIFFISDCKGVDMKDTNAKESGSSGIKK